MMYYNLLNSENLVKDVSYYNRKLIFGNFHYEIKDVFASVASHESPAQHMYDALHLLTSRKDQIGDITLSLAMPGIDYMIHSKIIFTRHWAMPGENYNCVIEQDMLWTSSINPLLYIIWSKYYAAKKNINISGIYLDVKSIIHTESFVVPTQLPSDPDLMEIKNHDNFIQIIENTLKTKRIMLCPDEPMIHRIINPLLNSLLAEQNNDIKLANAHATKCENDTLRLGQLSYLHHMYGTQK